MNLHLSSATIQSYENKDKSMDLFYNPVVIFDGFSPFAIEQLSEIKWSIVSDKIGSYDFDVLMIKNPAIKITEDKNFIEFKLVKKNVPFEYDNYPCKLLFSAVLKPFDKDEIKLEHEVLGIVKTKWSKGLL